MVENFGGTLNLILFLINLLGISYYGFLTVFSPNSLVTRYDLGEKALPIVRIIGTFIVPIVIIGIWILFRENGPQSCWIFFVNGFLLSFAQVILSWAQRLKFIDPDAKSDVADEVIGHLFLFVSIYLLYNMSDIIYM